MTLSILLPWFPVILAVGVGGRLLGRKRGYALGLLCALFWILLVQSTAGSGFWRAPWVVAGVMIGAAAVFFMGGWAGELSGGDLILGNDGTQTDSSHEVVSQQTQESLEAVIAVMRGFDDWISEHRHDRDPWSQFGEFVRSALFQFCQATHVKLYRLHNDVAELVPLREADPFCEPRTLSARQGVAGHVVTSGRSFILGDHSQGELVAQLASSQPDVGESMEWCFAIARDGQRLGVVTVGSLGIAPLQHLPLLRTAEQLVSQWWGGLVEVLGGREAGRGDPTSGLLNRAAFLESAQQSLRESYAMSEPVAVAIIALEGLRELQDSGRWEAADELVRETADDLRRKVRMDDCLGRFDESRMVWLLRRVDAELASLIVKQVMTRLSTLCQDQSRWRVALHVRCGVVGSGVEKPDLRTLLCRALAQSRRARVENRLIANESDPARAAAEAST